MKCSIVMATYNRPELLSRTLASIRRQSPPFEFECIVVDDGSAHESTRAVVQKNDFGYFRMTDRENDDYRNPGPARNMGYRIARGEVVICQSDDTMHDSPDAIERLVALVRPDNFVIATVENRSVGDFADGTYGGLGKSPPDIYTGPLKRSPLFFLGAVLREHIYAIGGNDEDFDEPGYEDNFFADCLMRGRGLTPLFTDQVRGIHQAHERPRLVGRYKRMRAVYERKFAYAKACGKWEAVSGPWPMDRRTV